MPQGVLPFKIEAEVKNGTTSLAGLPSYLELATVLNLGKSVDRNVRLRAESQGYTDRQMLMSLVLLQLAGGDCVDDLERLESDAGFCRLLRKLELSDLSRDERRAQERRWRKERRRGVPSASAARRYLSDFCSESTEKPRVKGEAYIPAPSEGLLGLRLVNQDLVAEIQRRSPSSVATLDEDATLVEVTKKEALHCYKGFQAYQPLNVWWAEQELMLHTEFRDGNVPAAFENRRVLEVALGMLPEGVEKVYFRADTAGYDWDLLRYMAEAKNPRFGVIEFAVGADVTKALKEEIARSRDLEWKPLPRWNERTKTWEETGQEWAEVVYVPNEIGNKKGGPDYRFLVVRERLREQPLPEMAGQLSLPFPTMEFGASGLYKLHALVTNRAIPGDEVIRWSRQRCGKSEEVHSILKSDLAAGTLPSKHFGVNAAWWALSVLGFNLNQAMKRLVLRQVDESWLPRRLKAIRFHLIGLPGRVVEHARAWILRVGREAANLLNQLRSIIKGLTHAPSG